MKTIGVFFGSRSPEHDISIITAMRVIEGFAKLRSDYSIIPVYISRKGEWFYGAELGDLAFFQNARFEQELARHAIRAISFADHRLILRRRGAGFFGSKKSALIDAAFPCFHGSYGEEGTIQGLFEMAGVPYVGCGVRASAIAMSKIHTRRLLRDAGIASVRTAEISKMIFDGGMEKIASLVAGMFYPLFVKPNSLGSSIGISRVANEKELLWALEVVFQFDTMALVEEEVKNLREINSIVIGHSEMTVSLPEEPVHHGAFQDFEAKYLTKGGTIRQEKSAKSKSIIPARMPPETARNVADISRRVFRLIGASGIMRCEFLYDTAAQKLFFGEINPLPGTLYAHVWEASGIPLPRLLEKLVGYAEERFAEERLLTRTFSSSVLQK